MRCDVGGNFDRPVWDSLHRDRPFGSLGRLQRWAGSRDLRYPWAAVIMAALASIAMQPPCSRSLFYEQSGK